MTREEAIKVLKKDLQIIDDPNVTMTASEWEEHDDHMRDALDMAIEALEQDRPTGHWIENDNGTFSCSNCQSWIPEEQHHYARHCLYCGARMESEEE